MRGCAQRRRLVMLFTMREVPGSIFGGGVFMHFVVV